MLSLVPSLLFLLLNVICSIASSNPDTLAADFIPSLDDGPNIFGLPSEAQDGANKLNIDATNPTYAAGGSSEAPLIHGNNDQCTEDFNQNSRKARTKRADSICSPIIDHGQPFQDSSPATTATKKTRPGFGWQIVPQTENGPVKQGPGPQAPYPDQSHCPSTAPFPVCAFSTVATIRPDPSPPGTTGSTVGRWVLDYCRCKYIPPSW